MVLHKSKKTIEATVKKMSAMLAADLEKMEPWQREVRMALLRSLTTGYKIGFKAGKKKRV